MSALREIFSRLAKVEKIARLAFSLAYVNPTWQTQSEWHVDFDNGSNIADGRTRATAIRTMAELFKRVGPRFSPKQDVTIFTYGTHKPEDLFTMTWDISSPSPGGGPGGAAGGVRRKVIMKPGDPLPAISSGTFTAIQVRVRATNTPYVMTDANRANWFRTGDFVCPPFAYPEAGCKNQAQGGIDFQRIRINGGPRDGAIAYTAAANLGNAFGGGTNGSIRTSNWFISNQSLLANTQVVPQVGDQYEVQVQPVLFMSGIDITGNDPNYGSGFYIQDYDIYFNRSFDSRTGSESFGVITRNASFVATSCLFEGDINVCTLGQNFVYFQNCAAIDTIFATNGFGNYVDGGLYHLGLGGIGGGSLTIAGEVFLETGLVLAGGNQGAGNANIYSAAIFDQPGHSYKAAILADDCGIIFIGPFDFYGANYVWGQDQTGTRKFGMAVQDGGHIGIDPTYPLPQITVAGVLKDFSIGRSESRNNQARTYDDTIPGFTTLRDCTYDNLFNKTIVQGGFGGHIVDLETGGVIGFVTSNV